MQQEPLNPNQVNTSILGMTSAMFTSLAGTVVTMAVKSNVFVDKTFNVLIHGVAAAEHIADAGEKRAKIYGDGIVNNGVLAERETTLKHNIRLLALELQENNAKAYKANQAKLDARTAKAEKAQATQAPTTT